MDVTLPSLLSEHCWLLYTSIFAIKIKNISSTSNYNFIVYINKSVCVFRLIQTLGKFFFLIQPFQMEKHLCNRPLPTQPHSLLLTSQVCPLLWLPFLTCSPDKICCFCLSRRRNFSALISKNFNSAREGLLAKFRVSEHLKIYNGEINTCSRVVTNFGYLFSRIVGPEDFLRFFSCSPSQIGYRESYDSGLRANRIRIYVFFLSDPDPGKKKRILAPGPTLKKIFHDNFQKKLLPRIRNPCTEIGFISETLVL